MFLICSLPRNHDHAAAKVRKIHRNSVDINTLFWFYECNSFSYSSWGIIMDARNAHSLRRLNIWLIKPSRYDDEGYVMRYVKGVLPSNTLACLSALTDDAVAHGAIPPHVKTNVFLLDETVHKVNVRAICRTQKSPRVKTVVCLVGVQSNEFPRAADLAVQFREQGIDVLIGGFHVSGMLAMFPTISPEIQALLDIGVTVVKGEVEEHWAEILADVINDEAKPLYDFLGDLPDMSACPIPQAQRRLLRRFITPNHGTIDCGRGCPFECSFCTIINVQGRKMRYRDASIIADAIRRQYKETGVNFYFFTDDNFSRNKNWEAIFDALIALRTDEGIKIEFMMQVDVLAYKIKNFVHKAKAAGCTQVFIGMESLNPKNLEAAHKNQNHVDDYARMIQAYRDARIATHVGYIIGFPYDTHDSVMEDVRRLKEDVKVDQASFFMLTPLPGSLDHQVMKQQGVWMEEDLNLFDSFHETTVHPNMKDGEWTRTYWEAWKGFLSFENMRTILRRSHVDNYWNIFKNFIWYKSTTMINGEHPMVSGFFRLKDRRSRRPGYPREGVLAHARRRVREIFQQTKAWINLLLEFEELWLQTRKRGLKEEYLIAEIQKIRADVKEWRELRVHELQEAYARASEQLMRAANMRLRIPSKFALVIKKLNLLSDSITFSREHIDRFWKQTLDQLRHGRVHRLKLHKILVYSFRDAKLAWLFLLALWGRGL